MADTMGAMVDSTLRYVGLLHFLGVPRPNILGEVPAGYCI